MGNQKNYSILEACVRIGKSPNTIRRWIKAGMPAERIEGKYFIAESDLIAYAKKMRER